MATALKSKADAITVESSLMVTQNILVVLLSQLCYVRNLFPEEVFNESKFGKCVIRALQKGIDDEADRLLKWLEDGVFSLLRKGNLVMMVLGIFVNPTKSAEFVEAWYFRVGCGGQLAVLREREGTTKSILIGTTREEVKVLSQNFVRTVIALGGTLRDLPKERFLTMRMVHFDDGGERPQGWIEAPDDQEYAQQPTKLSLGSLATPFNSVSLQLKTTVEDEEDEIHSPVLEKFTEAEIDAMWESDSDADEDDSKIQQSNAPRRRSMSWSSDSLSALEVEALQDIMNSPESVINDSDHPIFRFPEPVILKMTEIGALGKNDNVLIHSLRRQPNPREAARLYKLQPSFKRETSPDLVVQLSQISVSSPASSTVYSELPNYGKDSNDFAASIPTRRVYPAIAPSPGPDSNERTSESRSEAPPQMVRLGERRDAVKQPRASRVGITAAVSSNATRVARGIEKNSRPKAPPLDFSSSQSQIRSRSRVQHK